MKVLFIVITIITFIIFLIEGIIHYNVGLKKCNGTNDIYQENSSKTIKLFGYIEFEIPEKKEILLMSLTVLIFSSIAGLLNAYIIKYHLSN
jgi:hypothetical protein